MAALLEDFGAEGYGIFWHITELLHAEKTGKLEVGTLVAKAVARNMQVDPKLVKQIIDSCIDEYKLFSENGGFFTSERVQRNIAARTESKTVRAEAGRKGGQATQAKRREGSSNAKSDFNPSSSNAKAVIKQNQAQYSTGQDILSKGERMSEHVSGSNTAEPAPEALLRGLVSGWPSVVDKPELIRRIHSYDENTREAMVRDLEHPDFGITEIKKMGIDVWVKSFEYES